jgi:hypothetical protein
MHKTEGSIDRVEDPCPLIYPTWRYGGLLSSLLLTHNMVIGKRPLDHRAQLFFDGEIGLCDPCFVAFAEPTHGFAAELQAQGN